MRARQVWQVGLGYLGRGLAARLGRGPMFLTQFVTARCPLSCGHCFYRDEAEAAEIGRELSLDELQRMARGMPPVPKLILTGGEPFVREDLVEIAAAFADGRSASRQITIPTSGAFPARAEELARLLLGPRPDLLLELQLSIDGVGERHDAIRGPGSFQALMETWRRLSRLQGSHPGLLVRFNTTFSRVTQDRFEELQRFVTEELGHPVLDLVLLRKKAADPSYWGGIELERYRRAARALQAQEARRAGPGPLQAVLAGRARFERAVIEAHHRGQPVMKGCLAGVATAVVSETGELYPCEILDRSLGNLRDVDMDFQRLWQSPRARAFRREQRSSTCACTFETNVRTTLTLRPLEALHSLVRLGAREVMR